MLRQFLRYSPYLLFLSIFSSNPVLAQESFITTIQAKYDEQRYEEIASDIARWRATMSYQSSSLEYAKLCGIEAAAYGMMNQFDKSIPKSRRAIALLETHDGTENIIAELYGDILADYRLSGDFENSKIAGKELIAYSRIHLDTLSVEFAGYVIRSSYPYLTFDHPEIADSIVDLGLSVFLAIGKEMHPDINMAYNCKGILNKNRGNFNAAAIWYNKAKKVLEFNNLLESQYYVDILQNEANVLRHTGELDQAIENLLKAENLNKKIHGEETLRNEVTYTGLSNCYILKKEYDIGLEYGRQSLSMSEELYGKESAFHIENELAYRENLLIAGHNEEATRDHEDLGRRIRSVFGDQAETYAYYVRQVGKGLKNIGQYDQAIPQLLSSLTDFGINPENLAEVYKVKDARSFMSVMSELIDTYYRKWKSSADISTLQNAGKYAELGIQYIELFRKQALLSNSKLLFTSSQAAFIGQAIQVQYELYQQNKEISNLENGLKYIELSKHILYTENLKSRDILKSDFIPREEIRMAKEIRVAIQENETLLSESDSDSLQLIAQNKLHNLYLEESAWFAKVDQMYPEFSNRHYGNWEKSIESIRSSYLRDGELILDYLQIDTLYYAIGISEHQLSFRTINAAKLGDLNFTSNPQKISPNQLSQISELLLLPELSYHNDITLITTMPSGQLTYVPFEALPLESGGFAIDTYSFRQLINFQSQKKSINKNSEVLAIAPEYSNEWTDMDDEIYVSLTSADQWKLPGAQFESNSIVEILGGKLLSGKEATKENFEKLANQYGILHLSMHSLPSDANVLKSTLVFSSTEDKSISQHLTLEEIYRLDLEAQMVTLSACNTGVGEHKKGEGIMSIAHAFGIAGVPSTIMSLWKVPDESTSKIMISYYKHLKNGIAKDAALKEAKLEYLATTVKEQQKHPFYWAGFVVVGDVSPIFFSQSSNVSYSIVFSLVVFFVLYLLYKKRPS